MVSSRTRLRPSVPRTNQRSVEVAENEVGAKSAGRRASLPGAGEPSVEVAVAVEVAFPVEVAFAVDGADSALVEVEVEVEVEE